MTTYTIRSTSHTDTTTIQIVTDAGVVMFARTAPTTDTDLVAAITTGFNRRAASMNASLEWRLGAPVLHRMH